MLPRLARPAPAALLRKCAGWMPRLTIRAMPPPNLSLLSLVRHLSDTERG